MSEPANAYELVEAIRELYGKFNEIFKGEGDVEFDGVVRPAMAKVFAAFLASQGVYMTVEDGLDASAGSGTQNRFFSVVGEEGDAFEVRYRNDNGTAVRVGEVATAEFVRNIFHSATDGVPARAGLNVLSYSASLEGGELRPPLTDYSVSTGGTGANLFVPAGSLVSTRRALALGNIVSAGTGREGRVLRASMVVSRSGNDDPLDVEFGVAWYTADFEPCDTPETVVQTNESIGSVSTGCAFTFGREHARVEVVAPEDARYAVPFVRFPLEVGQPILIDLNVHDATDLANYEPLRNARVPTRAALEQSSITHSLEGGDILNRPPIQHPTIFEASTGPALQFTSPVLVARRDMVDIGLNVDPLPVIAVLASVSRLGASGGPDGVPVDVNFGVAWYQADRSPSATPRTVVDTALQIGFDTTYRWFTIGRPGADADVTSPPDAYFAIPYVEFTSEVGLPTVHRIDAYDVTDLVSDVFRTPDMRVRARGALQQHNYTHSLAPGFSRWNRPRIPPPSIFMGTAANSVGPLMDFPTPTTLALRDMVDLGILQQDPSTVIMAHAVFNRPSTSPAIDVEFGVAWYRSNGVPSDTPTTTVVLSEAIPTQTRFHKFTLGRPASGAEVESPADARFAIPFLRCETAGGLLRVAYIDAYDVTDLVALERQTAEVEIDTAELLAAENQRTLTVFDLPLRISAGDAAQLAPEDRALREWYYIEGGLVHRDDLPAYSPAGYAITADFPTGDVLSASVGTDPDTVTIRARPGLPGFNVRHFAARVDGVQGRQPTITITHTNLWNSPRTLSRHRLVWAYALEGDVWRTFDNQAYDSGANQWIMSNDAPFQHGSIYVSKMPHYSYARYDRRIQEWMRNRHTRPTRGGNGSYRIGTSAARTIALGDKSVPALDHFAFAAGTGERVVVVTCGIHPDESPSHWMLEGIMDAVLSDTMLGQQLRAAFTFVLYPNVNAQGLWAGAQRINVETGDDANRDWNNGGASNDLVNIYKPAFAADLTGREMAAYFDLHSTAATDPASGPAPEFWVSNPPNPREAALIEYMGEHFRPLRTVLTDQTGQTLRHHFRDNYAPGIAITSEFHHGAEETVDTWRAWGRDILRGLYALREQL